MREIAVAAPKLSCITDGTVDLSVATLSVNGKPVDARAPDKHVLHEGDQVYLFAPISGG